MTDTRPATPDHAPDPSLAFNPQGYAAMLAKASEAGFAFVTFGQANEFADRPGRHCLMRHDIDASLSCALRMAEIEASAGVSATYFVMLRSAAYNLFSRSSVALLREIVALGHEIGVHFDAGHQLIGNDDIIGKVGEEARIIAELSGADIHAVSFHQPSQYVLDSDIVIPGLINSYNRQQLEKWHYIADSNRRWRDRSPVQLFGDTAHDKIQLLTHPMWWMCDGASSEETWREALIENFRATLQFFHDTEGAFGKLRDISWSSRDRS